MAFFKDSHGPVRIKLRYFGDLRRARDARKLKRRIETGRTLGCIQTQERLCLAPEAEAPREWQRELEAQRREDELFAAGEQW